jgi:hypothetical protein
MHGSHASKSTIDLGERGMLLFIAPREQQTLKTRLRQLHRVERIAKCRHETQIQSCIIFVGCPVNEIKVTTH